MLAVATEVDAAARGPAAGLRAEIRRNPRDRAGRPGPGAAGAALVAERQREVAAVSRAGRGPVGLGRRARRRRSCSTARSSRSTRRGRPAGFQRLQGRINVSVPGYRSSAPPQTPAEQPTALMIFDLLRDGDVDWRPRPLHERRAALEARVADLGSPLLRLTPQVAGDGRALLRASQARGLGGAAGQGRRRRRTAPAAHAPSGASCKIQQQDEFVVAGWTEPRGTRTQFRRARSWRPTTPTARLVYVGDVGTGFTGAELDRVAARLAALATDRVRSTRRPRRRPSRTGCGRSWSCRCGIPR